MSSERAERLTALVAGEGLDQLIVGDLVRPGDSGRDAIANVRWLTGFTGTSGLALVGAEIRALITDFRYTERAEREVGDAFERVIAPQRIVPTMAERLAGRVRLGADQRRRPREARGARLRRRARCGRRSGRAASPDQGGG